MGNAGLTSSTAGAPSHDRLLEAVFLVSIKIVRRAPRLAKSSIMAGHTAANGCGASASEGSGGFAKYPKQWPLTFHVWDKGYDFGHLGGPGSANVGSTVR